MIKKILKILFISLLFLGIIVSVFIVVVKIGINSNFTKLYFKSLLKDYVVCNFDYEKIDLGFSNLTFKNIKFSRNVITIDKIKLIFDLLPFKVNRVCVEGAKSDISYLGYVFQKDIFSKLKKIKYLPQEIEITGGEFFLSNLFLLKSLNISAFKNLRKYKTKIQSEMFLRNQIYNPAHTKHSSVGGWYKITGLLTIDIDDEILEISKIEIKNQEKLLSISGTIKNFTKPSYDLHFTGDNIFLNTKMPFRTK